MLLGGVRNGMECCRVRRPMNAKTDRRVVNDMFQSVLKKSDVQRLVDFTKGKLLEVGVIEENKPNL